MPYKRYLETLLSYGQDARDSHLKLSMFEMDTAGHFETNARNEGHAARQEWVKDSKECEFIYWLQSDILNVDRYYPAGMKLRFVFHKSIPDWCLMEEAGVDAERKAGFYYQIKITSMSLNIRKVTPDTELVMKHNQRFSKNQTALYPYTRSSIKKFTALTGQTVAYLPSAVTGKLPTQIFLVMNKTTADLGNLANNPFYFQHFNLNKASLSIDGQELLSELYRNIGIHNSNQGSLVNKEYFKDGCSIISWNLTPDKSNYMPFAQGTVDIELTYSKALEQGITIILFCLYDDIMQIDASRNIIL